MSINKKSGLILFILIILPVLTYFFQGCIVSDKYFFWGYNCSRNYSLLISLLALTGSLLILYLNYKDKMHSKFWYILSGIVILLVIFNIIVIYSLSNFGF